MSLLRSSILAFLLIGWLPVTNSCVIAATFPTVFADCCASDDAAGSDKECCVGCAQFESGLLASTFQAVVPSIPWRQDDAWLERLLSRLSAESKREWTPADFAYSPPELLKTWQFSFRAAPAPRAPSLGS